MVIRKLSVSSLVGVLVLTFFKSVLKSVPRLRIQGLLSYDGLDVKQLVPLLGKRVTLPLSVC